MPRGLAAELRRAPGYAVQFRTAARVSKGGAELEIAVWELRSVNASAQASSRWRAADRRRHPRRLGTLRYSVGRHGGQPATAVLHVDKVTAELSLTTSMSTATAQRFLAGAASVEAHQLQAIAALTGFDRLSDAIAARHGPTRSLALQAFALIGGTGRGVPVRCPTAAWSTGPRRSAGCPSELPRFTAAQKAAVHRFLTRTFPKPDRTTAAVADGAAFAEHADHAITAVDYQAIADQMMTRIEAHTGPLDIAPVVSKDPYPNAHNGPSPTRPPTSGRSTRATSPCSRRPIIWSSGSSSTCSRTNWPIACSASTWATGRCGASWWCRGSRRGSPNGSPTRSCRSRAAPIRAPIPKCSSYRSDRQPGVSLGQLYSGDEGVGFLGHVADQVGVDTVWSRMPELMAQKQTAGALAALVGSSGTEVYNSWGGWYAQRADLRINWERIDPWPDPSPNRSPLPASQRPSRPGGSACRP